MNSLLYQRDLELLAGYRSLAGVDEAGRGALAGPVVIAAVRLDYSVCMEGLNDSKLLSPLKREALYERIIGSALAYSVIEIEQDYIDEYNILAATLKGMGEAISAVAEPGTLYLVDGNQLPHDLAHEARAVVKGDRLHACIAAASILAKVHRDSLMRKWHHQYPLYGFDRHKGYGTQAHLQALIEHGACPLHRLSFRPVSSLV